MTSLLDSLREFFLKNSHINTYWLAYSGGIDSHVLLHLCHQLQNDLSFNLKVLHVNHQLAAQAESWQKHCHQLATAYGFDYLAEKINIEHTHGESLEALARLQRYAVFAKYIQSNDMLLTAHHADDQAETLLMQLLRGSGLPGLAAMPDVKTFAKGWHARPLLNFTRKDLQTYAKQFELQFIEDSSNLDLRFTRNYLRHRIFPLLSPRFPNFTETFARVAGHCHEAQDLLQHFAQELLSEVRGQHAHTLSVSKLLKYSTEKQKLILRLWFRENQVLAPSTKKLQSILQNVLSAKWDKQACVQWQENVVRKYQDNLFLLKEFHNTGQVAVQEWYLANPLTLPGLGRLLAEPGKGGVSSNLTRLTVAFRQPGQRVNVKGRGHLSLTNLFQECQVPPWERKTVPLIFKEQELVAIVGYYVAPHFRVLPSEMGQHFKLMNFDAGESIPHDKSYTLYTNI